MKYCTTFDSFLLEFIKSDLADNIKAATKFTIDNIKQLAVEGAKIAHKNSYSTLTIVEINGDRVLLRGAVWYIWTFEQICQKCDRIFMPDEYFGAKQIKGYKEYSIKLHEGTDLEGFEEFNEELTPITEDKNDATGKLVSFDTKHGKCIGICSSISNDTATIHNVHFAKDMSKVTFPLGGKTKNVSEIKILEI